MFNEQQIQEQQLIEKLLEEESKLSTYKGNDRVISSKEALENLKDEHPLERFLSKIPTLDKFIEGFEVGELIVVSGPTKHGKCFGKGTEILMYDGSEKKVEDIKVGDKLMGDDSSPRKVLSLGQGVENLHCVQSRDKSSYIANKSHLLSLRQTGSRDIREISIREYLKTPKTFRHLWKQYKVGVNFPYQSIKIPSHLLGLWLGDGISQEPSIVSIDLPVIQYLKEIAKQLNLVLREHIYKDAKNNDQCPLYRFCEPSLKHRIHKNHLLEDLKSYNLIGNKHIPSEYKINSEEVRLELLAGLIDSDGYFDPLSGLAFFNKNFTLIKDVIWLARSLGFFANYRIKVVGRHQIYYEVHISGDLEKIPLLLSRKFKRLPLSRKNVLNQSFSIKKLGKGNYYGFEIDKNKRFLLADFTVVHNTTLCQSFTNKLASQGVKSLWFSFEMPKAQFLKRFKKLPLFYLPKALKAYDMDWIEKRIWEAKIKYDIKTVFIDHLHFLFDIQKNIRPDLEIGTLIRRLKSIALEHGLIIFLVSHTNKGRYMKKEGIPFLDLSDLRDSSFTSQESDSVLIIVRGKEENEAVLEVLTHRRTGAMNKKITLILRNYEFFEKAPESISAMGPS